MKRLFFLIAFLLMVSGAWAGSDVISVFTMEPYYVAGTSGCTLIPPGGTSAFTVVNNAPAFSDNRAIDILGVNSMIPVRYPSGIFSVQISSIASISADVAPSGNTLALYYQCSNRLPSNDGEWALGGTTEIQSAMDVNTGATGYVYSFSPPAARYYRILGVNGITAVKPTLLLWIQ